MVLSLLVLSTLHFLLLQSTLVFNPPVFHHQKSNTSVRFALKESNGNYSSQHHNVSIGLLQLNQVRTGVVLCALAIPPVLYHMK